MGKPHSYESDLEDLTDGYDQGDPCPIGCGGIITHRKTQEGDDLDQYLYSQCSRCPWNTLVE